MEATLRIRRSGYLSARFFNTCYFQSSLRPVLSEIKKGTSKTAGAFFMNLIPNAMKTGNNMYRGTRLQESWNFRILKAGTIVCMFMD